MKRTWIPVFLWLAATGCTTSPSDDPVTGQDAEAITAGDVHRVLERGLLAADLERSRRASHRGFVDAILSTTAPDAAYLAPGRPILHGTVAITAELDAEDPTHARTATFDPRRVTVSADGLIGNTFGWNVFTVVDAGGATVTTYGKYSTMWRLGPGGWRAIVHVQNPTGFTPSPAPADFPLLDDERPVIRLADPRVTAAQIAQTDRDFAAASVAEGSGPAFADEDAVEVAGPIIYGLDQVTANHAEDPPPTEQVVDWAPADAGASFTGDLGWSIGDASFVSTTDPTDVAYSKYLTVWERQPDTSWKWIVDMGNPEPAP